MPVTLADYYKRLPPIPPFGRWQRLLCRLGIHRWHRVYHVQQLLRQYVQAIPELAGVPWKKMNGSTYTHKSEAD